MRRYHVCATLVPVAVVVPTEGAKTGSEEVIQHCAESFARWQLPDDVLFWTALPLTSTGKLDKKAIRAQMSDDGYRLPDLRENAS